MKKEFLTGAIIGGSVSLLTLYLADFDVLVLIYKLIGFFLFIFSLFMGLLKDKDYFSPYTLFAVSPLCIILYTDKLSSYFLPLPEGQAIFNIILGQFCFLLGLTHYRYHVTIYQKKFVGESQKNQRISKYSYVNLFLLGMVPFILGVFFNELDITLSADNIHEFRSSFNVPIISAISCYAVGALLCAARENKYKIFIIMMILMFCFGLLTQARGNVVILFLVVIFSLHRYWKFKHSKTIIISALIVSLGFFQLYSLVRQGFFASKTYRSSYEYYFESGRVASLPPLLRGFYSPYMYLTTPLSNFAYLVERNQEWTTNGMLTAWPIISTFQFKRLYAVDQPEKPVRLLPYNTHTFMGDFYMDFGTSGIVILSILLGNLIYLFYIRSLKNDDCLIHAEYLYFGFATFMMFFSNHFTSIAYPLRILIVLKRIDIFPNN
jgi:hypothetical protein